MYSKRKVSKPLDKLKFRIEAAKSFDEDFDFGNGMNAAELETFSSDLEDAISLGNQYCLIKKTLRFYSKSLLIRYKRPWLQAGVAFLI